MRALAARWARNGWVVAAAAAAVMVGLIFGVQAVSETGSDPGQAASGPVVPGSGSTDSGSTDSGDVAPVPTAGGSIAQAAELFGDASAEGGDVEQSSTVDLTAPWPLSSCAVAGPAVAGAAEAGRVDFLTGSERGPEYVRDLAIGWYADATAAQAAYDGLLAALDQCASDSGARIVAAPATLGSAASVVTIAPAAAEGTAGGTPTEVDQSTYAVVLDGAVVVLAADHAGMFIDDATGPVAFEGTAGQAERLLTEACRVDAGRCG